MGYIPPPPGAMLILEPGMRYIEVTTLASEHPEYVAVSSSPRLLDDYAERLRWARHNAFMDTAHAETMRGARIGSILLVALALDLVAMLAQLAGLL